jgi:predicted Zn-dependent protease
MKIKRIVIFIAALAVAGTITCAKDPVTGRKTLNFYNIESEPRFGKQVLDAQMKTLRKKGRKLDQEADSEEHERIQQIVARIAPVTHYPQFPYEVHLAQVDVVNAWCAPGGKIMVYTGLWDPKKGLVEKGNEDQLAAVLAHEIAHANARHVTEALSRTMTIMMVGAAVQTAIHAGGSAEGANLFGEVFADGMNIYLPSYSRSNEFEADRVGFFYMAKAGYDPREGVRLWKKAAQKKKDRTSIYASHPSSGARAQELEKLLPEAMKFYEEALAKGVARKPIRRGKRR